MLNENSFKKQVFPKLVLRKKKLFTLKVFLKIELTIHLVCSIKLKEIGNSCIKSSKNQRRRNHFSEVSLLCGQYKMQTTDCRLGLKHRLGTKCRLQTMFKMHAEA